MPGDKERKLKAVNLALLLIISLICFGYVHSLNKTLYENLHYGYTDLVYFEQSLANFVHGHGLVNTGRGEDRSLFSEHAYFTHVLVSLPFYWLFPQALTLFDLGTLHVLAALVLAFYLAKRILKNTGLAWVCYILFLLNTYLIMSAGCLWRYGFHSEVFYLPYFLGLLYFWDKNRTVAILFFCLALLTKEIYAIPLFVTMLYFSIKDRGKRRTALILAIVCVFYFILVTKWIMPLFGAGKTAYNYYTFRWGRAFDVQEFLGIFFNYWTRLLIHFHFLPVLSPQILILALPDSLVNTLTQFVIGMTVPANPTNWHSIPAYGFMIWASLASFRVLTRILKKGVLIYSFSLVLMFFSVHLLLNSKIPQLVQFRAKKGIVTAVKKAEQYTSGSNSLCVAWGLAAPFMQKSHLYCFPSHYREAEYILFHPSTETLKKITGIQYEILLKAPRVMLLRNLSFRARRAWSSPPLLLSLYSAQKR